MSRAVTEWRGATPDTPIPPRVRVRLFDHANGCCEQCCRKLRPGDEWQVDHRVALINGGKHAENNLQVLCSWCHKIKTCADISVKAQTYAQRRKHVGVNKRVSRPIPGSKASGVRKRMSGQVERW